METVLWAVSYCIYNTEDGHFEMKLSTVNKIINEWEHYKDFIVYLSMVNSPEDYKNLLSRDKKYGWCIELTCVSRLFPNYLFRVHYGTNIVDYDFACIPHFVLRFVSLVCYVFCEN